MDWTCDGSGSSQNTAEPFIVAVNKSAKSPPISVRMCGLASKVCLASEVYLCGSVRMSSCWIVYGIAARCPSLWTRPLV